MHEVAAFWFSLLLLVIPYAMFCKCGVPGKVKGFCMVSQTALRVVGRSTQTLLGDVARHSATTAPESPEASRDLPMPESPNSQEQPVEMRNVRPRLSPSTLAVHNNSMGPPPQPTRGAAAAPSRALSVAGSDVGIGFNLCCHDLLSHFYSSAFFQTIRLWSM